MANGEAVVLCVDVPWEPTSVPVKVLEETFRSVGLQKFSQQGDVEDDDDDFLNVFPLDMELCNGK